MAAANPPENLDINDSANQYRLMCTTADEAEAAGELKKASMANRSAAERAARLGLHEGAYERAAKAAQQARSVIGSLDNPEDISRMRANAAHCSILAGKSAMVVSRQKGEEPGPEDEGSWWSRSIGQFTEAQALIRRLLKEGADVARLRSLFTSEKKIIQDPQVERMLDLDAPAKPRRNRT